MDRTLALASFITLITLGCGGVYVVHCAFNPFGRCRRRRCEKGRIYSRLSRKTFRDCPRCEGTGKRVRIGRRIYEHLRAEHKAGNR